MVGEKHLNPDCYADGTCDGGDNHSALGGFDWDINRWALFDFPPQPDTPGDNVFQTFGSAHPGVWNVVMCDGSVQGIPYSLDIDLHENLANRHDGTAIGELSF